MCIPSGFTRHIFSLHCLKSRDHILDRTRLHMTDMRLAVGGWWSVIERVSLALLALLHTFLEDVIVFPELSYLLFSVHKIQVRVYFVIHFFLQNKTFKAPVL